MENSIVKIEIGNEYDEALRKALSAAIGEIGAEIVKKSDGIAGSQNLEIIIINISGNILTIEAETFVGISVEGSETTVADFIKIVNKNFK